ncbi:Organic cation transporter protein [Amphibalanus amphitrite]|uniref:Organic cation transporter protein n=1 Tax=Amphibalanus amphitrite TaxID=1232801 RepID=A0A6A4VZA0_AMPAM|nr:Organic cation transporter protein [Amphibalanus amphitrite]
MADAAKKSVVAERTFSPVDDEDDSEKDVFFDDVMEWCCGSGRWQVLLVSYMSMIWLILPAISMAMMFVGASPDFKCADGFDANVTFSALPADTPRCHPVGDADASCSRWVFDTSMYESTVVTEWSLVCGRKPLLSMLQSWVMLGGIVGSAISGQLSDRFGRKPVFLSTAVTILACAFASALVTDYASFAAVRFVTGVAMATLVGCHTVMTMEMAGRRTRAAFGTLSGLPFPFGIMLVAAGSYALRSHRQLQLAYAVPFVFLLSNFWLRPESPHWLVVQGRFAEAYTILERGARCNRHPMPPKEEVLAKMRHVRDSLLAREAAAHRATGRGRQGWRQLVGSPILVRYSAVAFFISFVICGAYFGVTFDMTQLSASPHLAAVLSALVELPSYCVFPLLDRLGRRGSLVAFLLTGAGAMLLVLADRRPAVWMALGLVAKFGVSAAFVGVWVLIGECMPTTVRGLAFGVCQTGVRLGGAAAPFVVDLVSDLHPAAPSAVFGAAMLAAGLATLLLPETNNQPLPETAVDIENRTGRKKAAADLQGVSRNGTALDLEKVELSDSF